MKRKALFEQQEDGKAKDFSFNYKQPSLSSSKQQSVESNRAREDNSKRKLISSFRGE